MSKDKKYEGIERYKGPRKVLLVSDFEASRALYTNRLTEICEVIWLNKPKTVLQAIEWIERLDIKLVLVTLGNSSVDSEDFFRALKENPITAEIMPFAFISKPAPFPSGAKDLDPNNEIVRINRYVRFCTGDAHCGGCASLWVGICMEKEVLLDLHVYIN